MYFTEDFARKSSKQIIKQGVVLLFDSWRIRERKRFQQDNATPLRVRIMPECLDEILLGKWIGLGGA